MRLVSLLLACTAIAGCSPSENTATTAQGSSAADMAASAEQPASGDKADQPDKLKVSLPQLAYSYTLSFVVPGDRLGGVQDMHRALCDRMGAARCQLVAFERDDSQDQRGGAFTKLRVAASEAHGFSDALAKSVGDAGGRATGNRIGTEDVSKQIVDTKARIAQRELLVQRLTEVLRTRSGKVSELVEAERSVAQAQEELDQARGWLAELQGRVAMSDFEIHYTAVAPSASSSGVAGQLGDAGSASLATFVIGLRSLLTFAIYLLPWALLALPVVLLIRRARRRKLNMANGSDA